jgi:hypothetical protein
VHVAVVPVGGPVGELPEPMWVPTRFESVQLELLTALEWCVTVARELADPDAPPPADHWEALLDSAADGRSATVAPAFAALCGVAQMVINEVLPDFVSERYWITCEPQAIMRWESETPVALSARSRDGSRVFGLADAAQGLQLWLQLAVLEAAAALSRVAGRVGGLVLRREDGRAEPDEIDEVLQKLDALAAQRTTRRGFAVDRYFRLAALDVLRINPVRRRRRSDLHDLLDRGLDVAALFGGSYCYIIDEPEQHLHPAVAREAARWLQRVMSERRAQCLLTTHSVPFLGLGEETSYTYLWRDGAHVFARPIESGDLRAMSVLSEEMGFDRGELLATVEQLLFVEGRNDQIVLETLFGPELQRLGVAVIPIHSVGRLHRVVEAEALFRYTAAGIRVLLDNAVAPVWPELQADPERLQKALGDKRHTEVQALAQLLKTARQAEREADIEVLSIPESDMFFMLDESVLRELYPDYPGHAEAKRAQAENPSGPGHKRFRAQAYGVPDHGGLYAQVAELMREREIVPAGLADVVSRLEEWRG